MEQENFSNVIEEYVPNVKELLEKVYMDGFRKGAESESHKFKIDNIEYYDLGLPSGTCWSCAPQYFDYGWHLVTKIYDDVKHLNLPTKEQWEELCQYCRLDKLKLVAPNGIKVGYPIAQNAPSNRYTTYTLGEKCQKGGNKFWMKATPDSNNDVEVILFDKDVIGYDKHFTGYRLPFFIVYTK